ncbi:MAG: DNA-binding protein YbiB [Pseudomonadota bacterium]|jgi:anthranilate phosphoribosyltransferase
MSIAAYIREIGRGREGARALSRAQAADLFGQVLDGTVTDLEIGAFCLSMRIKGETPEEMAGFLDATHARLQTVPTADAAQTTVVIPSYNGARKLPLLTPLLAQLLAREGLAVLVHGVATESTRVFTSKVLELLDGMASPAGASLAPGELQFVPTGQLSPGLERLLNVRRTVGLRNSAHSVVKLMNPVRAAPGGKTLLVTSYTHPEYAASMAATLRLTRAHALLLRGTEGEAVADPRRAPAMQGFVDGEPVLQQPVQAGSLACLPDLPATTDPQTTAHYIRAVLEGRQPIPGPIAQQVEHILRLSKA